jgi:hypothetical protein
MRVVALFTAVFLITGCRTTALIHKKDGTVIEGKIRRSDASTIFVVPTEPSEGNVIEPSKIPERVHGTIIPELLDECVEERTVKCKQKCKDKFPVDYTKAEALKCVKSCPDRDTARSLCEVVSVEIPILRTAIDDIDHPGSSHSCIGLSISAAGVAGFIAVYFINKNTGEDGLSNNQQTGMIVSLLAMISGVISVPVWIWGTIVWAGSSSAAAKPRKRRRPRIRPLAMTDGERTYWGLGMSWSW